MLSYRGKWQVCHCTLHSHCTPHSPHSTLLHHPALRIVRWFDNVHFFISKLSVGPPCWAAGNLFSSRFSFFFSFFFFLVFLFSFFFFLFLFSFFFFLLYYFFVTLPTTSLRTTFAEFFLEHCCLGCYTGVSVAVRVRVRGSEGLGFSN